MNTKKLLAFMASGLVLTMLAPMTVIASPANVTVSQDVQIYLSGINKYFTLQSTSNALNQIQIDSTGSSFTVTTHASTGTVNILSPDKLDMGGQYNNGNIPITLCDSNSSVLEIHANGVQAIAITVTPSATAVCAAGGGGGGGSSSSGGGGSLGVAVSQTGAQAPAGGPQQASTTVELPPVAEVDVDFSDVNREGTRRLNQTKAEKLLQVVQLMVDNNTYRAGQRFKPFAATTRDFAIRIALGAVAGQSCGARTTVRTCVDAADAAGILDKDNLPRRVTRAWFYEMLLKTADIDLVPDSEITANLCSDVRATASYARVMATAKKHGIAKIFAGGKCKPTKTFTRQEATEAAANAIGVD